MLVKKKTKENKLYIIIAIIIIFMGVLRDGNLNLIYFITPFCMIYAWMKDRTIFKEFMILYIPIVCIFVLTTLLSPFFTSMNKSLIYLLKLFLCVGILISARNTNLNFDTKKLLQIIQCLIFLLTIYALVSQNEYMWRFNDSVNKYSKNRLQLFFQEPSELSEVCGILLIIQMYFLRIGKEKNYLKLLLSIIPLILSAGLSGLVYSVISVVIFVIFTEIPILKRARMSKLFLISMIILFCLIVYIIIEPDNSILLRIMDVLQGKDSSFNYRFTRAFKALKDVLIKTNFIGTGLGNIRTEYMKNYLWDNFNIHSFSNSYLFFFAEGGVIAIIYIVLLIKNTISIINKMQISYNDKMLRLALLFYLVIIQITGGYFTDAFLWAVTGFVASKTFLRGETEE